MTRMLMTKPPCIGSEEGNKYWSKWTEQQNQKVPGLQTVFVLEYKPENKTYRKKKKIDKYSAESTLSQISMGKRPNKKIKTFAYGNPTDDPICFGADCIFFKQKKRVYTLHSTPPKKTTTNKQQQQQQHNNNRVLNYYF